MWRHNYLARISLRDLVMYRLPLNLNIGVLRPTSTGPILWSVAVPLVTTVRTNRDCHTAATCDYL